jgi:hypothetical protein
MGNRFSSYFSTRATRISSLSPSSDLAARELSDPSSKITTYISGSSIIASTDFSLFAGGRDCENMRFASVRHQVAATPLNKTHWFRTGVGSGSSIIASTDFSLFAGGRDCENMRFASVRHQVAATPLSLNKTHWFLTGQ